MRRFITASDIEIVSLTGQKTLYVDEDDVVTSVAREMAEKLGVTILQGSVSQKELDSPAQEPSAQPPQAAPPPSIQRAPRSGPWVPEEFLGQAGREPVSALGFDDVVLKNGTIVWPGQGIFTGDIHISQGKIAAIHYPGGTVGPREIDVSGKYVMPGIIDPHIHLGIFESFEIDAENETMAGLWGGVTTVGCYLFEKGSYVARLDDLFRQVSTYSKADVFFHLTISCQQHLEEIPQYVNEYGIRSFKIYLSGVPGIIPDIDDGFMTRIYEKLAETGQRCTVCIHAENASLIRWATEEIMAKDGMSTSVQEWSETHPPIAEEEAIRRVALLTKEFDEVCTYFVHVSTKEGIEAVSEIKCDSVNVFAETTSPYLLFSIEKVKGNIPKWLPPLRSEESREALWEKLRLGRIDSLGTDSVAMSREIKGLDKSVWEAMPNAPVMEHHLPGILTEGVADREIPVATIVDLMTRGPAEIFGISPQKGSLLPGTDADLIVADMDRWQRVGRDQIRSPAGFSLFEGKVLTGWPVIVIKGGRIIIRDGEWVNDPAPCQVLNQSRKGNP